MFLVWKSEREMEFLYKFSGGRIDDSDPARAYTIMERMMHISEFV